LAPSRSPPKLDLVALRTETLRERGTTCSEFIYSLRLDHAEHLVRRRALLGASRPLSDIAYACGFRDYAHFARKFRKRFGCALVLTPHLMIDAPATRQCTPVPTKVRQRLTTSNRSAV
jgi:AraC-like DNA-binding protein